MGHAEYPPPATPVGSRSRPPEAHGTDSKLKSGALVLLAVLATGVALSLARALLVPLAFSLMLFFLLRPPVRWLAQRGVPRPLAGTLVLGAVLGLLVLAVTELAGPAIVWSQRMPSAVRELEQKSRNLRYPVEHITRAVQALTKLAEVGHTTTVPQVDVVKPGIVEGLLAQAGTIAAQIGLTVGAAFFMLVDGDALLSRLFRLGGSSLPRDKRSTAVINEVGVRMSSYLGAVTLVNLGLGVVLTVALALLGMPNPWLWGGLAAVLTYVPYVGPAIGIGLVTLASFVTFPTLGSALAPPLAYLALASVEGNLVTPFVLGRTCAIRPLVIFVWLALWTWLWSVPGAILAVPLLMLVRFVCDETPRLAPIAYLLRR
jgi:predicted PurR-regulated permease PerM